MRALTVEPGAPGSVEVTNLPSPGAEAGELLVDGLAVGVCGTDREIIAGAHGKPPVGQDRLVLGHESLGRVAEAPAGSAFAAGDLVVGVVRRPDPVPCGACAHGRSDMCRNGRYTERGIKELDGFASQRWTVEEDFAVPLDASIGRAGVLTEPTSVVAKAWDEIEKIGRRSWFEPERVLVTGAGPIGLLAALLGSQRGLDVHVLDRAAGGVKPELVEGLGATYHHDGIDAAIDACGQPDIIIEATGASELVTAVMTQTSSYGIVCLTGVSSAGRHVRFDAGKANREMVLENDVVFGSVNASRQHYLGAAAALLAADRAWLDRLVTREIPLEGYTEALEPHDDDVKVVLTLDG